MDRLICATPLLGILLVLCSGCERQSVQQANVSVDTDDARSDVSKARVARSAEDAARLLADVASQSVPQRLSENMTWAQVSAVGNNFSMAMIWHRRASELTPFVPELKRLGIAEKISQLCSDPDSLKALHLGVVYNYAFTSDDGVQLYSYSVSKNDCI